MKFRSTDPLLTAAKVIVALLIALCVAVMAGLAMAIGAVFTVERANLAADLAAGGAPDYAFWVVALAIAMVVGLFWHAYRFLRDLWAIIGSVDAGDPFRPENGDLLARMGWTALGGYITALLIALLAAWLDQFDTKGSIQFSADLDLGVGGLLLILTMFTLARVFRHGAAMRDDLEGTV